MSILTTGLLAGLVLGLYLPAPAAGCGCCEYFDVQDNHAESFCNMVASSSDCQDPESQYVDNASCTQPEAGITGNVPVDLCTGPPVSCGGLTSDPILQGFDNSTFEFCGQPSHNYSLFATPSLTLNMGLVAAGPEHIRPQGGEGTFAGSMAVLSPSYVLVATVDKAGNMSLVVNGASVEVEQPHATDGFTYDPYVPGKGQVVTMTEPPFRFSIVAVKQYLDVQSGYNRGHLDLTAEVTGPVLSRVSGLLGQTLDATRTGSDQLEQEQEYEIPALVHRGNIQPLVPKSRHLHLLLLPSLDKFPVYASVSSGLH